MKYPRYGCLKCKRTFDSFEECVIHMETSRHFIYDKYGFAQMTYPIGPIKDYAELLRHGYSEEELS